MFLSVLALAVFHNPHDDCHDLAVAPLPGGGQEWVVVWSDRYKVQRSTDNGFTWTPISGLGLDPGERLVFDYLAVTRD
jgi:hypothetical protein